MIDHHGEAVILGIKRTAAVFDMHKECAMDENDKWVAGHLIMRFGDKPGFKVTSSIYAKAMSTVIKMERFSYIERGDKDGDWRWGDKAKGFIEQYHKAEKNAVADRHLSNAMDVLRDRYRKIPAGFRRGFQLWLLDELERRK